MVFMVFTEEQNDYISRLYDLSENSPSEAKRLFELEFPGRTITEATIRYKWKDLGYERNPHGGHRSGLSDDDVRGLSDKYDGDIQKMMEECNQRSVGSFVKRCRDLGLKVHNVPIQRQKQKDYLPGYIA